MALNISIYNVIKGPRVSDKAHKTNKELNKLVLEVDLNVTKPAIKQAVQQLFNVKVDKVRTLISKSKPPKGVNRKRRVSNTTMKKSKIAYVSLAEGYSLDLFEQTEMPGAESRSE